MIKIVITIFILIVIIIIILWQTGKLDKILGKKSEEENNNSEKKPDTSSSGKKKDSSSGKKEKPWWKLQKAGKNPDTSSAKTKTQLRNTRTSTTLSNKNSIKSKNQEFPNTGKYSELLSLVANPIIPLQSNMNYNGDRNKYRMLINTNIDKTKYKIRDIKSFGVFIQFKTSSTNDQMLFSDGKFNYGILLQKNDSNSVLIHPYKTDLNNTYTFNNKSGLLTAAVPITIFSTPRSITSLILSIDLSPPPT